MKKLTLIIITIFTLSSSLLAIDKIFYGQFLAGNSVNKKGTDKGKSYLSSGVGVGVTIYQNYNKNGIISDISYSMKSSDVIKDRLLLIEGGYDFRIPNTQFFASPKLGYMRYSVTDRRADIQKNGNTIAYGAMIEHHNGAITMRLSIDRGAKTIDFDDIEDDISPMNIGFSAGFRF